MANIIERGQQVIDQMMGGAADLRLGLADAKDNFADLITDVSYLRQLRKVTDAQLGEEIRVNQELVFIGGVMTFASLAGVGTGLSMEKLFKGSKTAKAIGTGVKLTSFVPLSLGVAIGAFGLRRLRYAVREEQWGREK